MSKRVACDRCDGSGYMWASPATAGGGARDDARTAIAEIRALTDFDGLESRTLLRRIRAIVLAVEEPAHD
jgi:hypothetical protein